MSPSKRSISTKEFPVFSSLHIDRGGTVLVFPSSVVVAALSRAREVVLVRQYRLGIGRQTFELPGGRIEQKETPKRAAVREFEEESGYTCHRLKRMFRLDMDFSVSRHQTYVFQGTLDTNSIHQGAFEVVLIPLAQTLSMVTRGQISHAPTVAALLWLTRERQER